MSWLWILMLAYTQNISYAMVSRARNRDSHAYHAIMATLSNLIFFFTLRELMVSDLTPWLAVPYVIGTVTGSVSGAAVSMRIEKWLGAKT